MTKKEISDKRNEILNGVANKKLIQYYDESSKNWIDVFKYNNLVLLLAEPSMLINLRVKPEPSLIPYDINDDLIGTIMVGKKDKNHKELIVSQYENGVVAGIVFYNYEELLELYVDIDGNPLGKYSE